ncbi:hypothetical protein Caci_2897 [Catenulispora acidiphila DSM 44928]|uniref:Uncharacterized protein n=1 Tax=Catenulispora acidiphila (strain DSM 44928 / JCM 14897 / NBRC 102108 / NRRL B-24433 / ID139908) TaxID=479433 RepID=C7Q2R4_CATAD|nr:hypothetical protein [Catenulispora acidiphila]ACU71806.1 hypothetical protein Caci_2897 [Catenulispora acidiphila DSM 44928]
MSYSLVITEEASAVVGSPAMAKDIHQAFVLAMLELPNDPHGVGSSVKSEGAFVTRMLAVGPYGMIVYVVNETAATVTIVDVVWAG